MSEGGQMAALFAATYPERTRALVLYGTPTPASKATRTTRRACQTTFWRRSSVRSRPTGAR
ncbi:MAG: hypothetical protein ACR2IR_11555 [Acidimicrobiia bacterium]